MVLGVVEASIPAWALQILIALRFATLSLAVLSLCWIVSDQWQRYKTGVKNVPQTYYVAKFAISVAVVLYTPNAFMRQGVMPLEPVVAAICTAIALAATIAYFILTQTLRHIYEGEEKRTAWKRTVPIVLATVLLMAIGWAKLHVRLG